MALSDFVNVQISLSPQSLTRPGFGVPLILASDAPVGFTNRVRTYNKPDDLVSDGFSVSGPTYLMASRLCQQSTRPPKFKVGRQALPATIHFTLTPTAVNSATYNMTVNGNPVTFTADSSATATEIVTGLKAAVDALSISGLTSGGSTTMTLVMGTAGQFLDVSVEDVALLSMAQDESDPGVATDLAAIAVEDNAWYCLLNPFNSAAIIAAAAGWCETNEKLYIAQTSDSQCAVHAVSGASDIMATLKTAARFWTACFYSPGSGDFLDAAIAGLMLHTNPGSETWALKTVSGVSAALLTATQRANILGKNGNDYEVVGDPSAGLSITNPGKVSSGEWIDVVRFRDWLKANIGAEVFDALRQVNNPQAKKLPFTDGGIAAVQGAIKAVLSRGVQAGGLSSSPAPSVFVPKASDVSPSDKQNRKLTGVTFNATLADAIQAVDPINGALVA